MGGRIGMSTFDMEYTLIRDLQYDHAVTQNNGYQTKPRAPRQVTHTKTHPFLTLPDKIESRTMPPYHTQMYTFNSYLIEPDHNSYLVQAEMPGMAQQKEETENTIFVSNIRETNNFDNILFIERSQNRYNTSTDQKPRDSEAPTGNSEIKDGTDTQKTNFDDLFLNEIKDGTDTQKTNFDDLFRSEITKNTLGSLVEQPPSCDNDASCLACSNK